MVAEETNAEEKSSESKAMPLNLQTENKILSRKEKRKQLKKLKRKALRKEAANKEKALEEALLNDPEEQRRLQIEEQAETEASEKARQEFEERERIWLENYQRALEEEASRRKQEEEEKLSRCQEESLANTEADWECTEEQPAEVIWQGNEIIVKKKRVKVPKQKVDESNSEEREQPISNPLPPQPAFSDGYKCLQVTSGCNVFDDIEKQMPNFGTEQDAAHCPFYIKTGACRFGSHCSRAHFYPDKSCTLLMRNMYNGPGLSWEQDEGLEYTDEEVAMHYLEFYEDVHTEFLKFGELVNFKVCRNASSHLRGNVYVHYQSLDSALAARRALNGRFYAGKQITCEFVGVTKWRLAICGEYLRSYYKTCSRGNVCNFLHCFPNPGGEYGWADRDKPPPRSWLEKMDVLFGCSRASHHDDLTPRENVWSHRTRYKVSSRKEKAYGKYSRSNDRNNHQQNSASSSSKSYSEDEKEQELDTNKSIVCSSGTKGREHNVHDKDKIKNDNEVIPRNDKKGDQRKRHRSSKTSDRSSHGSKRRHHQEHTLADQDLEFGSINTSDTDDEPIQDKVKKNDRHESSLQSSQSKKEEKRPARRRSPEFDNIDDHDKTRSSLRRDQQYDKLSKSETSNRRDGSSKRSREYMRRERNRSRSPRIRDERSRSPKREHSRRKRVKQSRHSHRDLQKSPEENSIDSLNRWQPSEDSR